MYSNINLKLIYQQPGTSLSHNQPNSGLETTTSRQQEFTTEPGLNTCSQVKTITPKLSLPISSPFPKPIEHFPRPSSSHYPSGYSGYSLTVLAKDGERLPDISSIVGLPLSYRHEPGNALQQSNGKRIMSILLLIQMHLKCVLQYIKLDIYIILKF